MFTRITTAMAIILGVTSGALAATAHRQHGANPLSAYGANWDAFGAAQHPRHSPNPAWDVYNSEGHYVGSDPDPLVRDELRRDQANDR
jgi:hypothetical protein